MMRLLIFAAIGVLAWKLVTGRWPWERKTATRAQAVFRARKLLGVSAAATRDDILAAHKRLIAMVLPDRGGTDGQHREADHHEDEDAAAPVPQRITPGDQQRRAPTVHAGSPRRCSGERFGVPASL